ncbi:MAG: fimbrillin family protein [Bacteroidales bacterium]|nr:fimbrillin family protein [Bacteroidales bacterium]
MKRIIRMAAAAALSLLGGCVRIADPGLKPFSEGTIGFEAGSLLLRSDAPSRAGSFKDSDFAVDESILMFGQYHDNVNNSIIFNGTPITKHASSWDYSPGRAWVWTSEGDWYDFLAAYPTDKGTSVMDISGNLAIKTDYALASDNYDLLYAAKRRNGNEADLTAVVPMTFRHVLSAVQVVVNNESKYASFTLDSYEFRHLIVQASAKATMDGFGDPEFSFINTVRNGSSVRGYSSLATTLTGTKVSGTHSFEGDFDLFIPGPLDAASNGSSSEEYMPQLVLKYTPDGGVQQTESILLKDIQRDPLHGDTSTIGVWSSGIKYTYYVNIRLDGGVLVTVVTTDWDPVEAETPGLLIE